jgi:diaminopimelate epimerase
MIIEFYKYQGTGNDFIMIDDRKNEFDMNDNGLISALCERRMGIGADGLILLRDHDTLDFEMIYFNADGNQSSMCGNGGRCIVSFAKKLNVIKDKAKFMAIDGPHASFIDNGLVSLQMNQVNLIDNIEGGYVLDTGSPHFVKFCNSINELDVVKKGREIRNEKKISNNGINVNFVEVINNNCIKVRTYERGVENETLSCGTGVVASVLSAFKKGFVNENKIKIITLGGDLHVSFNFNNPSFENIWLEGSAVQVFKGKI